MGRGRWQLKSGGMACSWGRVRLQDLSKWCDFSLSLSLFIAELEFVQIIIIVVVMMVMVVVITCLLNHYKLSARSFINRHSQGRRREENLSSEGSLWPSESTVSGNGVTEQQVYTPRPTDRLAVPSFLQRDRFNRFQPTYPYMQHEIDLPPTISLSDGEEPPPYQGPCTLQLRDPEQQMELNRESVRAPPNRTIFDSDLIDNSVYGGPCPPQQQLGHQRHLLRKQWQDGRTAPHVQ
ncbi:hypothetical protein lerEdw1_002071 [Lerista edwardsae]|nr:hypothetical protein lerEdw1_002071 [Lerista edwardsae]